MLQISYLYFEECPSWKQGLVNLESALDLLEIPAEIQLIQVNEPYEAERHRFLGSPSIQINGEDLWPEERTSYELSCRVYDTSEGLKGVPEVEQIRAKLQQFKK